MPRVPKAKSPSKDSSGTPAFWVQHFNHNIAPQAALRESAFSQSEGLPQFVTKAKDDMACFDSICFRFARAVLADGGISSNQTGKGDIERDLIKADFVDRMNDLYPFQSFM